MKVFVIVGIVANLIGCVMFVHSGLKDKVLSIFSFFFSELMVRVVVSGSSVLRTCLD